MEADREMLRGLDGLFVGQLEECELGAFDRLIEAGEAHHSYEGMSGFLGMAKVRLTPSPAYRPQDGEGA